MPSCLIIKNDGLGDLILSSGIIAEISRILNTSVDLVTCINNREIAENIYGIGKIYYVSRDQIGFNRYLRQIGIHRINIANSDLRILIDASSINYDYIFCLRRFIRASSLLIMNAVQGRKKYCSWQFSTNTPSKIAMSYSNGWNHFSGDLKIISELSYFQRFIEHELSTTIDPTPRIKLPSAINVEAEAYTLGICLGGQSTNWPQGYWINLIQTLQELGWNITLFGGKDVHRLAKTIQNKCRGIKNAVGSMTFIESINTLRSLSAFIGNDTGFTHFASLIVPKLLVICGGGTFGRFFPWPGAMNQHVIYFAKECFDCDWRCKYLFNKRQCMKLVKSKDVVTYFLHIMGSIDTSPTYNINKSSVSYQLAWRRWNRASPRIKIPGSTGFSDATDGHAK